MVVHFHERRIVIRLEPKTVIAIRLARQFDRRRDAERGTSRYVIGNCEVCDKASDCRKVLETLSEEWDIVLPENLPPTEMGMQIFSRIMEELEWKSDKMLLVAEQY